MTIQTPPLFPSKHSTREPHCPQLQSPILRGFRRLVAATCIANGAEAEAAGNGWDMAYSDWAAEAEAAWERVRELSALIARQQSGDLEDSSLIGAAWLIHAAVTCDTADRLFALREQMRTILGVCKVKGRGGRFSAHAHLLHMAVGLLEDICDRLLGPDEDMPDLDKEHRFPVL